MSSDEPIDPWFVLDLPPEASPKAISARYRDLVKVHPPDREPRLHQLICEAYDIAMDTEIRYRDRLLGPKAMRDWDELQAMLLPRRLRPVGAKAWLAAARERRQRSQIDGSRA